MKTEFKRVETVFGAYNENTILRLLSNYAAEGWDIIHYNEIKNDEEQYKFIVLMKKKIDSSLLFYDPTIF